jgi:hypothetical protein
MKRVIIATVVAGTTLGAVLTGTADAAVPAPRALPGSHCTAFPANNYWHADISKLPVNRLSTTWLNSAGAGRTSTLHLHPDFGSSGDPRNPYGIPYVVESGKPKVKVSFDYADESDKVAYPLWPTMPIEGGLGSGGDMHAIVVDAATCTLYETWNTQYSARAHAWSAGSGATWKLKSNTLRPNTWTSADAAGLPILPGLLRWDEVKAGRVDHAIRFTLPKTFGAPIWPARHQANSGNSAKYAPFGARFRLKASYPISRFSRQTQVVLKAMKKYGIVLADNGSAFYFQGAASNSWPDQLIGELKSVSANAFEAVNTLPMRVSPNSAQVKSAYVR